MSNNNRTKRAAPKPNKGGVKFVPLKKKDVERSVAETLLRDKEVVERIERQLDEIMQKWVEEGITPMTMAFLATELQEFSMAVYHEGYKEAVTGMWGRLCKSNREVFEKDFEKMCRVIRRHGANASMSHMEKRKKECCGRSSREIPQIPARDKEEATYIPSKDRPSYIY
jgi:hypothetical protein